MSGNEPWKVAGGTDTTSLRIPGGGSVSTPEICVASNEDSLRFFVKPPAGSGSSLTVSIRVVNPVTGYKWDSMMNLVLSSPLSASAWTVAAPVSLPDLTGAQGTQNLQVTFITKGTGTWLIDDVYVDPYRTK